VIKKVRGSAWPKRDKAGNVTGEVTRVIKFRPSIVGVYDSKGKLSGELDGKEVAGKTCEEINLWIHSEGGRGMAKQYMMAILGYNPNEGSDEAAFNEFLTESGSDLSTAYEENEAGDGYVMHLGDGWEQLFVGKNVRAHMEPQTREVEGRDPVTQQNYVRLSPVNA